MKLPTLLLALFMPAALTAADPLQPLRQALTFHASFDQGFDADFSRGEKRMQFAGVPKGQAAGPGEFIQIAPGAGRFGAALHVTKKNPIRPFFPGPGIIDYKAADWSGSVSVWLRLTPDEDLEPGYCDPVQIVGDDSKKGFIFLEWSKDEKPRHFRYAIRPLVEIWNPKGLDWAKMTDAERPMVALHTAPFSRDRWTHAVFTYHRLNSGKAAVGELYLDGKPQGSIRGWDLTFGWQASKVQLVLAAAYVGHIDDLAAFDRALTAAEVAQIFSLKNGIRDLR